MLCTAGHPVTRRPPFSLKLPSETAPLSIEGYQNIKLHTFAIMNWTVISEGLRSLV